MVKNNYGQDDPQILLTRPKWRLYQFAFTGKSGLDQICGTILLYIFGSTAESVGPDIQRQIPKPLKTGEFERKRSYFEGFRYL